MGGTPGPLRLLNSALGGQAGWLLGYHPVSVLVPQALMGVASVALLYDLVGRRFGRLGGFVAGVALALTPITVAISRHNNPDALLVLCSVAALWCAARALEDGRTRWLAGAGVCVGLGFETKMGVALTVVPGIAAAWLWMTPAGRGRLHALRQLLIAGAVTVIVGGAWPALVELTPAASRPWVSSRCWNAILRADSTAVAPSSEKKTWFKPGGAISTRRRASSAAGGCVAPSRVECPIRPS